MMYAKWDKYSKIEKIMQVAQDKVREALKTVIDPELGVNMVDLGLLYDIVAGGGDKGAESVEVIMTLTTPGCPMAPYFYEEVRRVTAESLDIDEEGVTVTMTFDPPWVRDMMSEEARAELGM